MVTQREIVFGSDFLDRHAGQVYQDPIIAAVELIANAWDAGATSVRIRWEVEEGKEISFADDGAGMSRAELERRWRTLSYRRADEQGPNVAYPPGRKGPVRKPYGANGIGRHASFCFANRYRVVTVKGGKQTEATVTREAGAFSLKVDSETDAPGHGTIISVVLGWPLRKTDDELATIVGTRFIADPGFRVFVNDRETQGEVIDDACEFLDVSIPGLDGGRIRRYDAGSGGRTSNQHGIAWWVHGRLVGHCSWQGVLGPIIDARQSAAKRYTYIVEANALRDNVKPNWTGFFDTMPGSNVRREVEEAVRSDLHSLNVEGRRQRKLDALRANQSDLRVLPPPSQVAVSRFADNIALLCPTISERDMSNAVSAFVIMEKSRTKFALLERLANIRPQDVDTLHKVLDDWSIADMDKVLGELRYRIALIRRLDERIDDATADELHEIQPLMQEALWMFGPEFESVHYLANRAMATMLRELFGQTCPANVRANDRPDIVALVDGSLAPYACEQFGHYHEVVGYSKVVIIELKAAGVPIGDEQTSQAKRYAKHLIRGAKLGANTQVLAFVLGSEIEPDVEEMTEGRIRIVPRTYRSFLASAHARTFHLMRRLESTPQTTTDDGVLQEVLEQQVLGFDA